MKFLHLLVLWLMCQFSPVSCPHYAPIKASCSTQPQIKRQKGRLVRITVYTAAEDSWSKKLQSSSGAKLRPGQSIAVDPKLIPYGTKVKIEGWGTFLAVDTGKDVVSKKASKGKLPIIDVFCVDKKQADRLIARNPEITTFSCND